jgi:hypothetical protein
MPDGTAFTVSRIQIANGAEESFEDHFYAEVLPALKANPDGQPTDQHFLLDDIGSPEVPARGYFVLSTVGYDLHQTPVPVWLHRQVDNLRQILDDALADHGTRVSSELFYDVGSWRRRLGKPT